jgi:hypothetical protein
MKKKNEPFIIKKTMRGWRWRWLTRGGPSMGTGYYLSRVGCRRAAEKIWKEKGK